MISCNIVVIFVIQNNFIKIKAILVKCQGLPIHMAENTLNSKRNLRIKLFLKNIFEQKLST